jgi:beta-lactamase regulating signal transducer with metallopeptidase domain
MSILFDLTNSTGYVSFKNLLVGTYTFRILKDGFIETNQTINFKGTPMTLTVTLDDGGAIDSQTLMTVAIIVVVAVVIAITAALYFIRMRRTAKVRKLQQLQKHLKDQQQL